MEVAGQWRREWAGAAEYGKVTEGGVTRRVARAMEVLNASAPGARVRVVRAAFHSSSGPGAPTSSYMMHSSRRVISSGTRLLSPSLTSRPFEETPSLPSLPLEISSTPLDVEPDKIETDNYKVTEPDDSDISAPSKWKVSMDKNSIRMPSEESSSTDNASIIDIDSKTNHRSVFRKYSYDSENSDISTIKLGSNRASPLLDAPVTLSTLKYKTLLNGSNDWNNRRKSYSFEETAPLRESISHTNDLLAMESSTDSGICKSSEIVNGHVDYDLKDNKHDTHEDSFKDWLHKNRQTTFNKSNSFQSYREHGVVIEENENNITVQSKGKVSITFPISFETEDEYQYKKAHTSDDVDRRVKKVEFCKTELHFAAESGKVNIIATDEKPPPTNDFRRKKSAFVPINNKPERPITLFGDRKKIVGDVMRDTFFNHDTNDICEFDENTAATKSILKNKIPKPKPYLLGENMAFGLTADCPNATKPCINNQDAKVPPAVSLINSQLQSDRRFSNDASSLSSEADTSAPNKIVSRPINSGLPRSVCSNHQHSHEYSKSELSNSFNLAKNKFTALQMSPVPTRSKTRQLRQSDLTYFGIQNDTNNVPDEKPKFIRDRIKMHNDAIDKIFQSVRLIQQVSSSVCNSEAESEESVEYQNLPVKTNFAPVPTPRLRSKYTDKSGIDDEVTILKPTTEQDSGVIRDNVHESRRSRSRRYEDVGIPTIRSISEPPKFNKLSMNKSHLRRQNLSKRNNNYENNNSGSCSPDTAKLYQSEEDETTAPIYANVINEVTDDKKTEITEDITRTSEFIQKIKDKDEVKVNHNKDRNRTSFDGVRKVEKPKDGIYNKSSSSKRNKTHKTEGTDVLYSDKQSSDSAVTIRRIATEDSKHRDEKTTRRTASVESKHRDEKTIRRIASDDSKHKDEKTMSIKKHNGSHRRGEKNASERFAEQLTSTNINKSAKEAEAGSKSQRVRSSSRHLTAKNTIEHPKIPSMNSSDRHRHSLQMKSGDKNGEMRYSKDRSKTKRNGYVINYDDKNGTVTSICKISNDSGSTNKEQASLERIKDGSRGHRNINRISEKRNMLQFPDPERNPSGLSHSHKRSKTKVYIQRSCQLL